MRSSKELPCVLDGLRIREKMYQYFCFKDVQVADCFLGSSESQLQDERPCDLDASSVETKKCWFMFKMFTKRSL